MVIKENSYNEGNLLTPEPTEIVLTDNDLKQTAESIAEWQLESGMIPWFPGGLTLGITSRQPWLFKLLD